MPRLGDGIKHKSRSALGNVKAGVPDILLS